MQIPSGHQAIMPYIILTDAAGFVNFIVIVFGAEKVAHVPRPGNDSKIMHSELNIGGSAIMCCDATGDYTPNDTGLFIYVTDADAAFARAVENGAKIINKMADQQYGRTGGVKDPFGVTWWITTPLK